MKSKRQGESAMLKKIQKILRMIVVTAAVSMGTAGTAQAVLRQPDVVYFGMVSGASSGSIITIMLDAASALASCAVRPDLKYACRVPIDAIGQRLMGTARTGDEVTIAIDGVVAAKTILPAFGTVVKLGIAKRTVEEWAKLHPGDDGSGDLNGNGVTDLEEFLAGKDPAAAPIVSLSTLTDNATTKNPVLNVAGTVSGVDAGLKTLTVNGTKATVTADGAFSAALVLTEGPNVITVEAVDNADRKRVETRTITLDRTAPELTVALAADNSITDQIVSTITGSVDPTSTVTVKLNNNSPLVAIMDKNMFSGTVNLASGMNTIQITSTDPAGNISSAKRTITYDNTVPSLAITLPAQDVLVTAPTITIAGTVSGSLATASVLITTGTGTYTPTVASGRFSQVITLPTEGMYSIAVTATDTAGNTSTVVRNVIYIVLGDLDEDGDVDVFDAVKALRIASGLATPTPLEAERADVAPLVDGKPQPDGKIDIGDVIVILRRAVGLTFW